MHKTHRLFVHLIGCFGLSVFAFAGSPTLAATCPAETEKVIESARTALESNDPAADRQALACLVEAVVALDAKLAALIAGQIDFTGVITARGYRQGGPLPETGAE